METVESEERGIGSILKEIAETMQTIEGEDSLPVGISEAVGPQFQMLMELARLKKQGVDV